jgi:hypothetical protein
MQTRRQGKFAIWSVSMLVACMAVGLLGPSLAEAEPTSIYEEFTKCPTGAPEMNEPTRESAGCFSTTALHGTIKLGSLEVPLAGAIHIQFAVAGFDDEEVGLVHIVPNSTSVDTPPFLVENPNAETAGNQPGGGSAAGGASKPAPQPAAPTPTKQVKKHKKKKRSSHHKRKRHHGSKKKGGKSNRRLAAFSGARASAVGGSMITVNVEPVGDMEEFNLIIIGEEEIETGKALKLPLRLHLEGEGLGSNCYIGPIVLEPEKVKAESTFFFGHDPNDFHVELLGSGGSKLEDRTLSVPSATGCGLGGLHNGEVNEIAGLPAASGQSRVVLAENVFRMAAAPYDGTGLDGGAELQAAFDAAQ